MIFMINLCVVLNNKEGKYNIGEHLLCKYTVLCGEDYGSMMHNILLGLQPSRASCAVDKREEGYIIFISYWRLEKTANLTARGI